MKNFVCIFSICILLSIGCGAGGSKEARCKKAIDHSFEVMKNDPTMKKMGGMLDKMIEHEKNSMNTKISKCVDKYDDKRIDCVMAADTLQELSKCGN